MRQRFGIAQALLGQPHLVIVDEPTAGLDPEERNRFLNLLAEIGENVVVILSTHIVEDVADLCPNMAIIASGRIVKIGAPLQLIDSMQGRVWRKTIAKDQLEAHRREHEVIATRLFGGRTVIHVLATRSQGRLRAMQGGLEDVYSTLAAAPQAAENHPCSVRRCFELRYQPSPPQSGDFRHLPADLRRLTRTTCRSAGGNVP
jgi:ABC-type multidrug transport system ATPase subunit